ncbi:hypothetical protein CUZ93_1559 [Enterococcus xinjiangensis]|nr:hypothetical protein [Enterococcus lactis]MBL4994900.1 hypothetical protein [Enterococcus lactis]MBL5013713.1 hypothetical protein [Enterococcus lactis]
MVGINFYERTKRVTKIPATRGNFSCGRYFLYEKVNKF